MYPIPLVATVHKRDLKKKVNLYSIPLVTIVHKRDLKEDFDMYSITLDAIVQKIRNISLFFDISKKNLICTQFPAVPLTFSRLRFD